MTPEQNALLAEWHRAQTTLKQWEEYERGLRERVVNAMFGNYGEGSRTLDVGNGWKLSNTNVVKYTIADSQAMRALVPTLQVEGPADKPLVRWKPDLSQSVYKSLSMLSRDALTPHVTYKPQAPQLKLIPPKA